MYIVYIVDGSWLFIDFIRLVSPGNSTSRADSIPTAHVTPHPATVRTSAYHPASDLTSSLRRAVSTHDFSEARFRSTSPTPGQLDGLLQKTNQRRWSSHQNLQDHGQRGHGNELSFHEVGVDPDPTLSESRFIDPEELGHYSKQRSQSHLSLLGTGGGGGGVGSSKVSPNSGTTVPTSTDNMYGGYLSVGKDLYSHPHAHTQPHHAHTHAHTQPLSRRLTEELRHAPGHYGYVGSSSYGPTLQPTVIRPNGTSFIGSTGHLSTSAGSLYAPDGYGQDPADSFASDITSWQQRHQEQLRRQHYEATQVQVSASLF